MRKKIISLIKYIFFLGLGIFLVWWSLHQIPKDKWNEFSGALKNARYILIVPVFFILATSHLLRALRWKILMNPMGYNPSTVNTFLAVLIGYLANLAVPRLGEVLKCTILSKYEKVPADKLVGTIVTERAIDVILLGLLFLLVFITQYNVIGEYGKEIFMQAFMSKRGNFSLNKIIIVLLIIAVLFFVIKYGFKKFAHLKMVIVIKNILKGVWEGLISVVKLKQKKLFIIYSFGIWFLYLAGLWVGLYATEGTEQLGFLQALSGLAFASIGMILTPGGIGAYAYFLAKVLEQNNVPFAVGYANGTLQWFAQFLIVIFLGFASLLVLPWYNKGIRLKA
jgi:uncharacterized protein (TIRG00374 family)